MKPVFKDSNIIDITDDIFYWIGGSSGSNPSTGKIPFIEINLNFSLLFLFYRISNNYSKVISNFHSRM